MKQRIQKLLGSAGVASRRNVEEMIRQGRISVNGQIRVDLPLLVEPGRDKIEVDGQRVTVPDEKAGPRIYILLYKPKDVYSTNVAQGDQRLAIDLLPPNLPGRVYPVGRLDAGSKGLLLLTNDGELTNRLTHPRYGVAKTYRAVVDGYVAGPALQMLEKGMWLGNQGSGAFKTGRSRLKIINRSRAMTVVEITIHDRRNQQVRRMFARAGYKVRELTRIRIGPLTLHGLSPGESRLLTAKEVRQLQVLGKPVEKSPPPRKE